MAIFFFHFSITENEDDIISEENVLDSKDQLSEEVLAVLGDDPVISKTLNISLHASFISRWKFWYQNGLEKEDRENLLIKYDQPPEISIPKLNPEIEAKLPSHVRSRDLFMCKRQQLVAAALNAMSAVMKNFIQEETDIDRVNCLQKLHEAGKLMIELMNSQIKSRRAQIVAGVDKDTKSILESTESKNFLFGEKLSEKVKEAREMDKIADSLKKQLILPVRQAHNSRLPLNYSGRLGVRPTSQYQSRHQGFHSGRLNHRLLFRNAPRNQPFNQNAPFRGSNPSFRGRPK